MPHAYLQAILKAHVKFQKDRPKTVGGWMDGYFVYRRSTLKGHIASNRFYVI